jgi:hypothetical protein
VRALPLALLVCLASCHPGPEPLGPDALAQAQATLAPFKRELKTALLEGMAEGPIEALQVCRVEAPRIAAENATDTIELGRTSHRLRNPSNAPRPWVEPILAEYVSLSEPSPASEDAEASDAKALEPRVVRLSQDRMGYVEPIRVQGLCLTCHGPALDPELAAEIERLYPEDRATGFAAGDFRGVFWLEMPIP